MADKLMRAQVTIPLDSGVPEDSVVNTFYFDGDDFPGATDSFYHGGVMSLLTRFYNDIDQTVFPNTVGPLATVKIYDMRDATPRVPENVDTITLTPFDGPPLPSEVAICISFAANVASGELARRRRGRVFLGPIAAATPSIINSQSRVGQSVRDGLRDAMNTLKGGFNTGAPADSSIRWAIYSPTTDIVSTVDDAFNDVTHGWVDDSFDTQRRRGPKPTTRSTFQ